MAAGGVTFLANLVSGVTAVHCVNEHLFFFSLLLRGLCNNGVLTDSFFFFAFYGSEAFPLLLTLGLGVLFSHEHP